MQLDDPQLFRESAFIDGRWIDAGTDEIPVLDPATGERLGAIPTLGDEHIDQSVAAAHRAFAVWREYTALERAEHLNAWYDLMHAHRQDLAYIMTREQGKPLEDARGEIDYGASFLRWFAEQGRRTGGATIPSTDPSKTLGTVREPVGVAAVMTPWNFPVAMITRKVGAALAAGCPVIVKPASETPLSALALAELARRAGLPPGVFNVVTGKASAISERLCDDERVRALSFTGSTPVGRQLLHQCADTVKRVGLELGGNAPLIVCEDMDPDAAASEAIDAKFQTGGQDCLAANRLFVHRSIHDRFVACFSERMRALKVGNGLDADVDIGPLIHERAAKKAQELVDDAVNRGATQIGGDQSVAPGSNYFMPTMLTDVSEDMRLFHEESFAPVAPVWVFDDYDAVIDSANNTPYGLASYVFTHDVRRMRKLVRGLDYGMVGVNTMDITGPSVPFGGMKQSGLGREGGAEGMDEYLETKYYCIGDLPAAGGSPV